MSFYSTIEKYGKGGNKGIEATIKAGKYSFYCFVNVKCKFCRICTKEVYGSRQT